MGLKPQKRNPLWCRWGEGWQARWGGMVGSQHRNESLLLVLIVSHLSRVLSDMNGIGIVQHLDVASHAPIMMAKCIKTPGKGPPPHTTIPFTYPSNWVQMQLIALEVFWYTLSSLESSPSSHYHQPLDLPSLLLYDHQYSPPPPIFMSIMQCNQPFLPFSTPKSWASVWCFLFSLYVFNALLSNFFLFFSFFLNRIFIVINQSFLLHLHRLDSIIRVCSLSYSCMVDANQ